VDFFMGPLTFLNKGGAVSWILLGLGFYLWYALGYRFYLLKVQPKKGGVDFQALGLFQKPIHSIVMVAPLLGLLGTVIGMIETFSSLGSQEMYSQSGGIAGGISQALLTTQMGLMVAIPGLVFGRQLDKLQISLEEDLEIQGAL